MKTKILNIKSAVYIGNYKMIVQFENGELRIADFNDILIKDMGDYSELKEEDYFQKRFFIEAGTIVWNNGYDVAPDFIYKTSKPITPKLLNQIAA